MIASETTALVLSIAKGLVKLGQRLDALLAEKEAVQAKLVLIMPGIYAGPSALQKATELGKYLADTDSSTGPDPLGSDRNDLIAELKKPNPSNDLIGQCYREVFPERLTLAPFQPDAAYITALRQLLPTLDFSNEDTLAAVFAITAGQDDRGINYAARVGLLVVDVVAEFGAENTALFVRNARMQNVVQAVLERFAEPDLEKFTEWSPLLRHVLSATLNGALDARGSLGHNEVWLTTVLDVLAEARADPAGGDDFLVGLLQGKGYPLLVSKGLNETAQLLSEDQANAFKQLASDILKSAAPLVAASPNFKEFFSDHWGDLLRASLTALERHGPDLLQGQPKLLSTVLVSMVAALNKIPQASLLSNETLYRVGDAVIAAVAANPALIDAKVGDKPWVQALLESFVNTVARDGLQLSFSRDGLDAIITNAAGIFAAHPELLGNAANAGLMRDVVGSILQSVAGLPSLDARNLATAAANGALQAVAANPNLVGTGYAKIVADFSGRLAAVVKARTLTGTDAATIATAVSSTLLNNPALFGGATSNLAVAALDATLQAAQGDPAKLLSGGTLVETIRSVLAALARTGKAKMQPMAADAVTAQLTKIIQDSLAQASNELGSRLDLPGLPGVIGGLVAAWAHGDLVKIDPADPAFQKLMESLLLTASTR